MDPNTKLPGISRMTEAELRTQYTAETGQPVPEHLTTTAQLREAITAHRTTTPADAPGTALDTLLGEVPAASSAAASDADSAIVAGDTSEVEGQEQTADLPLQLNLGEMQRLIPTLNEDDFGHLLEMMHGEAHERGIIGFGEEEDEEEEEGLNDRILVLPHDLSQEQIASIQEYATTLRSGLVAAGNPNDSAPKRDTGPSANAAGPIAAPAASDDVPEGFVRVTHKTTKLQQDMPKATWDVLGKTGQQDFTRHVPKPQDLR